MQHLVAPLNVSLKRLFMMPSGFNEPSSNYGAGVE